MEFTFSWGETDKEEPYYKRYRWPDGNDKCYGEKLGFPDGSVVKNPPANAGDVSSIPGSGRSPGEGHGNHSSTLVWEIPWPEEPGRLQSMGSQRVKHNLATK